MIPPTSFALHGHSARIPSRGLGTFQVDPKQYPEGSVKDSVLKALEVGYRHFDAALGYGWGSVEVSIGQAIKESRVPREELFIITKLHASTHIQAMVKLQPREVPYAYATTDNYGTQRDTDGLKHQPIVNLEMSRAYDKTWQAMESLVDKGTTKMIGVSNFSSPKIKRLISSARIHPVVNQVELNPYFPQMGLLKFCKVNNVHITAYGPLGCKPVPALIGTQGPGPLQDAKISEIAQKYSTTPAQVILCFMINRGVSVIPKTNNLQRIAENFDCLSELDIEDYHTIDQLMGPDGERGVRNLETRDYLGFDNFNEEVEEP
ncbi:MAG: hypothetical protein Q9226_001976 [Calogaya cf. arnoldii]